MRSSTFDESQIIREYGQEGPAFVQALVPLARDAHRDMLERSGECHDSTQHTYVTSSTVNCLGTSIMLILQIPRSCCVQPTPTS